MNDTHWCLLTHCPEQNSSPWYGVRYQAPNGHSLCFDNLTDNRQEMETFLTKLAAENPEAIHLPDIIDDFLAERHLPV